MSTATKTTRFVGLSPTFVLFCIFLTLKLTGFVAWPWLFVFAPLWAPLLAAAVFFGLAGVLFGLAKLIGKVAK